MLEEFKQQYKLKMYLNLMTTVVAFLIVSVIALAVLGAESAGVVSWAWQYSWIPFVVWQALNLGVIVAVSLICLPSGQLSSIVMIVMTMDL